MRPTDHLPGQPDGEEGAQQQAAQDVQEEVLVQGQEGALRLEMPRAAMPDYVLDPEGGLLQRMYGIIAEALRHLQGTPLVLRITDQDLDIPHQPVGGEFGEDQGPGIALAHRFNGVPVLVPVQRDAQHRHAPVDALLGAEDAAVRDEELHIRMRQDIVLGHPLPDQHVRGQIADRIVLELPDHLLLQLAKGLEDQGRLLGRQVGTLHVRTQTEVDHAVGGLVQEALQVRGQLLGRLDVCPAHVYESRHTGPG